MTYALIVQSIDLGMSEPASLVIFGTGLVCASLLLRRRMKTTEDCQSSVSPRRDLSFGGVPLPSAADKNHATRVGIEVAVYRIAI